MRLKSYNILFQIFSFLSDKTNGAPFFVKRKLSLGTLIIGLTGTSVYAQKTIVVKDTVPLPIPDPSARITCYDMYTPSEADNTIEVKGQVIDESREPLIGVSIMLKGSTNGVSTDINGNFSIKAKADNKLIFSYIGMEEKEVPVSAMRNGKTIVTMKESSMIMCYEVVIVSAPFKDDIYASSRPKRITKLSYTEVSKPPVSIVGDLADFEKWVQKNIVYNETLREKKVHGEVILSFAIDKKGNLVDKKVIGKLSKEADKEALRVLSSSEKWKPGELYGNPVKTTMTIKINFDYR
ncbi:MAG: carboxypeptidase-like regulatory domain-containing protein [Dysgonomonas sp.]